MVVIQRGCKCYFYVAYSTKGYHHTSIVGNSCNSLFYSLKACWEASEFFIISEGYYFISLKHIVLELWTLGGPKLPMSVRIVREKNWSDKTLQTNDQIFHSDFKSSYKNVFPSVFALHQAPYFQGPCIGCAMARWEWYTCF